jgi:hypothetical protein
MSMMPPTISIVTVWRPAVRTTDDTKATVTLDPVKQQDRTVYVKLYLQVTFALPPRDEHLLHAVEAHVRQAGLQAQRALFRALIEHADRQLILAARAGKAGQGVQLRGTRPFHFKTGFGTVAVERVRVTHRADGSGQTPSAEAWGTGHRRELTRGPRAAICDQMLDESAGAVRHDVGQAAGGPDLVGRSTARRRDRKLPPLKVPRPGRKAA